MRLRSELEAEREKNDALEARIALLVNNTNDVNDEITHLRATITSKFKGPMTTYFQKDIKFYHFLALDRDKDALTMALDDKSERLAELEAISKQNDLAGGQNRQTISKLNQEIELLQDQIDDLERKESQSRKLLDEKVETNSS